jgi:disulfide bond formation protein DsbB
MFLALNFLLSLSGFLGSLYFSEVVKYPPCTLCWYQRICLYPLLVIFGVALWTEDRAYAKYAWPLALIGGAIAVYHNLLYYGIIAAALAPCTKELSCSARQLELFGFVTIPLLSFLSFVSTLVLLGLDQRKRSSDEK